MGIGSEARSAPITLILLTSIGLCLVQLVLLRRNRIGYIHFRNVKGKFPRYYESFVDEGDIDMAEIVRILRDENFKGVLIPDHTPAMACESSWHAGKAFALGYMRALVNNADGLGASWSLNTAVAAE